MFSKVTMTFEEVATRLGKAIASEMSRLELHARMLLPGRYLEPPRANLEAQLEITEMLVQLIDMREQANGQAFSGVAVAIKELEARIAELEAMCAKSS